MVTNTFNPSTQDAETSESLLSSKPNWSIQWVKGMQGYILRPFLKTKQDGNLGEKGFILVYKSR